MGGAGDSPVVLTAALVRRSNDILAGKVGHGVVPLAVAVGMGGVRDVLDGGVGGGDGVTESCFAESGEGQSGEFEGYGNGVTDVGDIHREGAFQEGRHGTADQGGTAITTAPEAGTMDASPEAGSNLDQ